MKLWAKPEPVPDDRLRQMATLEATVAAIMRSQAVIEFDVDGTILEANVNFLAVTGYRREEIVGRKHAMLMPEADRGSAAYADFWRRLRAGEFMSGEFRRIAKDGRDIWIQATYNPLFDEAGKPYRIIKFASDITEAKRKTLEAAGQIEAISRSQAVIEFTLDGTILRANENFCATMGYDEGEIVGRHHSMFVDEAYARSQEYRDFWAALRRGEFFSAEFERRGSAGERVWIRASYNPIFDADGRPVRVIKFATDITAEMRQREITERLSLVADNTDNSVIITDPARRIQYVNAGFERITGYRAADVIGQSPGKLLQGKFTDPATIARMREKLNGGEAFYEEILNYNAGGEPYWISLAINPIRGADGSIERFISIQADITETKKRALEHTEKLDAISQSSAIAEWNIDGRINTGNEALRSWEAVTEGEEVHLHRILSPQQRERLLANEQLRAEVAWPRISGGEIRIDAMFVPMVDFGGEVYRILMCGVDISDRRAAVSMTSRAVKDVLASGEEIVKVATTVENIAFKTTMLAINAAIEAGRAGDAGRGFAVVADEVRNLASRCAEAAASISLLVSRNGQRLATLEGSLQKLDGGTQAISSQTAGLQRAA